MKVMFKKIIRILLVFVCLFFLTKPALAAEDQLVTLYLFWSKACPHCAKEKVFLNSLAQKYSQLIIKDIEITASQENIEIFRQVGQKLAADTSGVPFTVVGEHYFIGFLSDETTGKQIEQAVQCALADGCGDAVGDLLNTSPSVITLPLLGEIETKNFSLPVLTFVVALLDGFNPCAMWVLLFLISLLLGMKDRRRMWLLGITFIVASALVYFFFMAAWLNLFLFLGFVLWVRVLIGLVALAAGGYSLRDYWVNKSGLCKTAGSEKRQKIFARLRTITQKKQLLLALGGMILLAFAVNLIELVCSAGLPAIYTQILTLTKLPRWQYYLYLAFYIFIFMLDDLFVFFVAMTTLRMMGIQSKYSRWSRLIGGSLMLAIGILMLFKPEWLMFG